MKSSLQELLTLIETHYGPQDTDLVRLAFEFADEAHRGQTRFNSDPYITHPLAVAATLARMKLALPIVIAGLLHDVPDNTSITLSAIEKEFGKEIALLVGGVMKLGSVKYRGLDWSIENLRKMFVAMAADVRVVFVKFADRLHNLETLDAVPKEKRRRIALESLEIYAPIANRLGMGDVQSRLEDAAFPFAYPKEYEMTKKLLDARIAGAEGYQQKVLEKTQALLHEAGVQDFTVQGRTKHIYSLYRKLVKFNMDIDQIFDIFAVRILVPSVADCYHALGILHGKYVPLPGRIKDYISQPKPNGYQSLHTTVFCEDGRVVEFQIRTPEMHEACEQGIAAHWFYDESGKRAARATKELKWVQELAKIQEELKFQHGTFNSLDAMKIDVFQHRIFVFTPRGDVVDLPEGSTPVDFAYAVHTDLGNQCSGAKINGKLAALDDELKSGDMIEIVADKRKKKPNPDWLAFVKTNQAKSRIRAAAKDKLEKWLKEPEA